MNILEAAEAIKNGKVVKSIRKSPDTRRDGNFTFYLLVHLSPLDIQQVWSFDSEDMNFMSVRPQTLDKIFAKTCNDLSITILNGRFQEIVFEEATVETMLKDLQQAWDRYVRT